MEEFLENLDEVPVKNYKYIFKKNNLFKSLTVYMQIYL